MKIIVIFLITFYSFIDFVKAQWTPVLDRKETITCLYADGKNVYAGTSAGGVFISQDEGLSWSNSISGLPKGAFISAIQVTGTNIVAGTGEEGLFLSDNKGKSWREIRKGFKSYQVNAFAAHGNYIYAGTLDGVFVSYDNGESWKPRNILLRNTNVLSLTINKEGLFAGTKNGGVFFLGNDSSVWHQVSNGLTDSIIYALASIGTNLFATTYYEGAFLSRNNGASWSSINNGLKRSIIDSTLSRNFADSLRSLFGRKDLVEIPFPGRRKSARFIHSLATKGKSIFASCGKVFLSTDNGLSWHDVSEGLEDKIACIVSVGETYIYAGTITSGVWRRPLSEILSTR